MNSIKEIFKFSTNLSNEDKGVYPHTTFNAIKEHLKEKSIDLFTYVNEQEHNIEEHIQLVIEQMLKTVQNGLQKDGYLDDNQKVKRIATDLNMKAKYLDNKADASKLLLTAYVYAASEEQISENISEDELSLTNSTILSALVYHYYNDLNISKQRLTNALCVAAIFANIIFDNNRIKPNESIKQEIATECSISAVIISYLNDANLTTIENAATIAFESSKNNNTTSKHNHEIYALALLRSFDASLLSEQLSDIKDNETTFDNAVLQKNYNK